MAKNSGWTIRPAAEADLADIWLQGVATWGPDQAERYTDGLFAIFDLLVEFPEMARERAEFTPPVRIHPSGSHLVVCRRGEEGRGEEGRGVEIIRILHARQNLMAHLSDS